MTKSKQAVATETETFSLPEVGATPGGTVIYRKTPYAISRADNLEWAVKATVETGNAADVSALSTLLNGGPLSRTTNVWDWMRTIRSATLRVCDTEFRNCDFTKKTFEHVDLSKCKFFNCKFDDAILRGCTLDGSRFERCTFERANVGGTRLNGAIFIRCKLIDADFGGIQCCGSRFIGGRADNCRFVHATLDGTVFFGVQGRYEALPQNGVQQRSFHGASLARVKFYECKIRHADFCDAKFMDTVVIESYFGGASFDKENPDNLRLDKRTLRDLPERKFRSTTAGDVALYKRQTSPPTQTQPKEERYSLFNMLFPFNQCAAGLSAKTKRLTGPADGTQASPVASSTHADGSEGASRESFGSNAETEAMPDAGTGVRKEVGVSIELVHGRCRDDADRGATKGAQ